MEPRDTDNWAKPIDAFHVDQSVEGARKGNVEAGGLDRQETPVGSVQQHLEELRSADADPPRS